MKKNLVITLGFCFSIAAKSQVDSIVNVSDSVSTEAINVNCNSIPLNSTLTIVFAGDIMGHDAQILGAWDDSLKLYNYEPTFRHIKDYISSADLAIGNLEVTLAGPPFKGYPQFSSPDELAKEAKEAGFDILVTANNHALDRGGKGIKRTQSMLDSIGFLHTGTFTHDTMRDQFYPLIVEKNNIKLAFLNYTYGTNGIKVDTPLSVNRIDTAQIRIDLEKAKLANPDFIIAIMHWGVEYERQENKVQDRLARFIFTQGADAIIGSHPHVIQPIRKVMFKGDTLHEYPVYYSMGNFVSNQRAQYKDGGIMAELHLSKKDTLTVLDSAAWLPYWVYRKDMGNKSTFYVVPVAKFESDTTLLPFTTNDYWKFNRFKKDTRELLKDSPVPESSFYKKPEEIVSGIREEE